MSKKKHPQKTLGWISLVFASMAGFGVLQTLWKILTVPPGFNDMAGLFGEFIGGVLVFILFAYPTYVILEKKEKLSRKWEIAIGIFVILMLIGLILGLGSALLT